MIDKLGKYLYTTCECSRLWEIIIRKHCDMEWFAWGHMDERLCDVENPRRENHDHLLEELNLSGQGLKVIMECLRFGKWRIVYVKHKMLRIKKSGSCSQRKRIVNQISRQRLSHDSTNPDWVAYMKKTVSFMLYANALDA